MPLAPKSAPWAVPRSAEWILRCGVMMDFLGHGMVGLGRPSPWAAYFAVVGIGRSSAYGLMPWVAVLDISMAVIALLYPLRSFLLFMTAWTAWTAFLRPLAGEPFWEAIERAGNYGAPLALLLILDASDFGFRPAILRSMSDARRRAVRWSLLVATAGLLLGHGVLGVLFHKALLASHYSSVGLPGSAVEPWIGGFEILLAVAVVARPGFGLLVFICAWKVATELLNPIAGSSFWVFVEHGGSYAAPLALALFQRSWSPAPSRQADDYDAPSADQPLAGA